MFCSDVSSAIIISARDRKSGSERKKGAFCDDDDDEGATSECSHPQREQTNELLESMRHVIVARPLIAAA